jgi:hypothetical protein
MQQVAFFEGVFSDGRSPEGIAQWSELVEVSRD